MTTQITYNIISAANTSDSTGNRLILLIQPQPIVQNGVNVTSPYTMGVPIPNPTAAQLAKYVYGGTYTTTSDT